MTSETLCVLSNLPELRHLHILAISRLCELPSLPRLNWLELYNFGSHGFDYPTECDALRFPELDTLMLNETSVTLSSLTSLRRLCTSHTDMAKLSRLCGLQHLDLEKQVANVDALLPLQQLTQLRVRLEHNQMHQPALPIARLTSLVVLELWDAHINTETVIEIITHCTRLQELWLHTPPLTDILLMRPLVQLPALHSIHTNLKKEVRKHHLLRKRIRVYYLHDDFPRSRRPEVLTKRYIKSKWWPREDDHSDRDG